MNRDEKKAAAAVAALELVPPGAIVGVGTGSTINHFIEALGKIKHRVAGAVASSEASAHRLRAVGIPVLELNGVDEVPIYVDGADEATCHLHLLKGGGGALTREKIVAAAARQFVCIVDDAKLVDRLGAFPLPIEVIPMARSYVSREIARLGGKPEWREGVTTDNGNVIVDVRELDITDPVALECELNQLTGTVANGLFARRPADLLLVGADDGVRRLE